MGSRAAQSLCILAFLFCGSLLPAADSSYTIKEGETLFSISRKANVPVYVLISYNSIADPGKLKVGAVIHVPILYSVRKGDTLYGIAREHSVPLSTLRDFNKLTQASVLKVGDTVFIPRDAPAAVGGGAAPTAVSAAPSTPSRSMGTVVWPHLGKREPDTGTLPGIVIFGSPGDIVRSATAGEVKWAATWWGFGKIVIIRAADGSIFYYRGTRELLVNVGDRVGAGSEIAKLGESPQGGGSRLYFSIQDANRNFVDPEKFFSAKSQS